MPSFPRRREPNFACSMSEEKFPPVYILANGPQGTIYVGVTSALWNRVATHKDGTIAGFTSKYDVKSLVWYEHHVSMGRSRSGTGNGRSI